MTAFGRKQPLKTAGIYQSERPVLGKADITLQFPKRSKQWQKCNARMTALRSEANIKNGIYTYIQPC